MASPEIFRGIDDDDDDDDDIIITKPLPGMVPNSKVVAHFSELQNTTVERCSAVDLFAGQSSHWRT